jgi:hypothetical protein
MKFGCIPPAYVRLFVKRQKNDAIDAKATCEAALRAKMRFVAVKSEKQQAAVRCFEPVIRQCGSEPSETRPEEPGILIVPRARIYDLVSARELPYGPAAPLLHDKAGQMAASDYVPNFLKNRLHLAGRPQMSTYPFAEDER